MAESNGTIKATSARHCQAAAAYCKTKAKDYRGLKHSVQALKRPTLIPVFLPVATAPLQLH